MSQIELVLQSGETLTVHDFSVSEGISELFSVSIVARAKKPAVDLQRIVGEPASLQILAGWEFVRAMGKRSWSGIVNYIEQIQALSPDAGLSTYRLSIVPDLWKLTQRTNYRIFQHLSIPEIADVLFAEWTIKPVWQVDRGACPPLEMRMQYGESDFHFLNRLLEEAGIAYTFQDLGNGTSTLVLSDSLHTGTARPSIPFVDNPNEAAQKEYVMHVRLGHHVRPGAHVIRDYDFQRPAFILTGTAPTALAPENRYEQYHYSPGAFVKEPAAGQPGVHDQPHGTNLATRGLQSLRADKRVVSFTTNTVDLGAGTIFTMANHLHPDLSEAARLLITSFTIAGSPDDEWSMNASAVFASAANPYKPPMKTAKPRILGVQSAAVVGPKGQEIHVDEYGRIKVQFPWDREGKFDDNSSCWIRVGQGWSGTGYGLLVHPRIGQEVLITFIDGDPDRPIVTGRVHNELEKVPYPLPDNKTVSTWKSQSSPATGGYNEIKFEDQAQKELVYVRAERDLNKLVKRDEVEHTQRNKLTTIDGTEDVVVKGVRKTLIESADHLHVKMDQLVSVDGSISVSVSVNQQEKITGRHALDAGQEIHLKAGTNLILEAGMRLTIKGPGGFIDIHAAGIDIVGTMVNINSGGSAGTGQGASPTKPTDAAVATPSDKPV